MTPITGMFGVPRILTLRELTATFCSAAEKPWMVLAGNHEVSRVLTDICCAASDRTFSPAGQRASLSEVSRAVLRSLTPDLMHISASTAVSLRSTRTGPSPVAFRASRVSLS